MGGISSKLLTSGERRYQSSHNQINDSMVHYIIITTSNANYSMGSDMNWKSSIVNLGTVSVK